MKKGKAITVTTLVIVMLAIIDYCLHSLYATGFVVLTGLFAVYGYVHFAVCFFNWLLKCETEEKQEIPKSDTVNDRENVKTVHRNNREKGDNLMQVLNEEI